MCRILVISVDDEVFNFSSFRIDRFKRFGALPIH